MHNEKKGVNCTVIACEVSLQHQGVPAIFQDYFKCLVPIRQLCRYKQEL